MIDYTKQVRNFSHQPNPQSSLDEVVIRALLKKKTQLGVINQLRSEGDSVEVAERRVRENLGEARRLQRLRSFFWLLLATFLIVSSVAGFVLELILPYPLFFQFWIGLPVSGVVWAMLKGRKISF